jgi:alanine racemase
MAQEYGISKAVVRREAEAELIKEFFDYILILAPSFPVVNTVDYNYTINTLADIEKFPTGSRVELKVDTGMHRNGIGMDELDEAFERIEAKKLSLEAVFTHFRSSDAMSAEWFWQKTNFEAVKKRSLAYKKELRFHSANSAALFRSSDCDEDMVRIGIAAYGCLQMDKGFKETGLKPVLSLYADKISSRRLGKGERLGYNATFEADKDTDVTNYDIGYADGLMRALSNNYTTPDGYTLLGRVSMDNSSYECSAETLLVFDDANAIAAYAGTIGYEVLTSLSASIVRRII